MVIYADVLFSINLAVNYLALLCAAKICALPGKRLRILAGAAAGAVYALLCVLRGAGFLLHPLIKAAMGVMMVLCAYGGCAKLWKICLVFFAVSALFGGAVLSVSLLLGSVPGAVLYTPVTLRILIPAFAVTYAVVSVIFKRAAFSRRSIVETEITLSGKSVVLRALEDSGNQLRELVSGRPVMIAEKEKLLPLFDEDTRDILLGGTDAGTLFESLAEKGRLFRLIPFRAVGTESGLLLAFLPDSVSVGGKLREETVVAVSSGKIGGSEYSAVINA